MFDFGEGMGNSNITHLKTIIISKKTERTACVRSFFGERMGNDIYNTPKKILINV